MRPRQILAWLSLYAIAMACVEAALVVYLRELYYPRDPRMLFPLNVLSGTHLAIEWVRELATLAMILAVAWLAAPDAPRRFAAFVFVFGVWDIFYYLWLKVLIGWPMALAEWDVLFLLPWPWFGPWLAPISIALLFVAWGGRVLLTATRPRFHLRAVLLFLTGAALALAAFLAPAAGLLAGGVEAFRGFVPGTFAWWLFVPGWLAMAAGLVDSLR